MSRLDKSDAEMANRFFIFLFLISTLVRNVLKMFTFFLLQNLISVMFFSMALSIKDQLKKGQYKEAVESWDELEAIVHISSNYVVSVLCTDNFNSVLP